ncbi:hypothetical protein MIND_01409400 [Mycena indigotica]|uniref:DUF6924 domain-containing protein n=1 Tax=Mycena indigotica TaxID=2126181 RepID=A0A8H6VR46_9AGAR|nr:uncharacterized protein MIND_01409400 [Mycena indigotica]KAF7288931.1 hypothetical protein MIND_01409400 [Mycena indigotica]
MTNWAIFLTAAQAPPKTLNRALLYMHDFENSPFPPDYGWILLSSKTLPSKAKARRPTRVPITPAISASEFAGMSLAQVNAFVRANSTALEKIDVSVADWAVLDQKGLETSTCLVCEQVYDGGEEGADEGRMTDEFRACRIPYEKAWGMIANLDISNMDFEDFIDQDAGEQEDGSWLYSSTPEDDENDGGDGDGGDAPGDEDNPGDEEDEGTGIKREAIYEMLKAGNHVD